MKNNKIYTNISITGSKKINDMLYCVIESINFFYKINLEKILIDLDKKIIISYQNNLMNNVSALTICKNSEIKILLYTNAFNGNNYFFKNQKKHLFDTLIHEFSHVLDLLSDLKISEQFMKEVNSFYINDKYYPNGKEKYEGTTKLGHTNHYEDFADSFTVNISGDSYEDYQGIYVNSIRKRIVKKLVKIYFY